MRQGVYPNDPASVLCRTALTQVIEYDNLLITEQTRGPIRIVKASVSFHQIKEELMQDEEFRIEYERLQPRYQAIAQIIKARQEQNMTQAELARRVGTQKSNISRLESGNYNPSLDFLVKVARSLGKNVSIKFL